MITHRERRALEKNRRRFDALVQALDLPVAGSEEALLDRILRAVNFAWQNDTGCYCSPEIEAKLCEIARRLPERDEESPLLPGTILHVMTSAYLTGGHTRIVERWIANSPSEETHSVVLIDQDPTQPHSLLEDLVKTRGGRILQLPPVSLINKGVILRALSRGAAKIVLHVHMNDPVPILAYGTPLFKVPVIFFNHASHLFWIGASITDLCANISWWSCAFSQRRRGITRTAMLPIPVYAESISIPREDARRTLGVAAEARVIVTMASEYKYDRYQAFDFFLFLLRITADHPERIVMAIGPSPAHPIWELLQKISHGRIRPCGEIPFPQIGVYLSTADLYIESFPFGSATALLDVANLGIPTLSLRLPLPHLDSVEASGTICPTIDDLCHRVDVALLAHPSTALMMEAITRDHRPDGWLMHLKALYSACPATHRVTDISTVPIDRTIGDLEAYINHGKWFERGDYASLLRTQFELLSEFLRLIIRFSPFNASCWSLFYEQLKETAKLLLRLLKIAVKSLVRGEKSARTAPDPAARL